jgi:sRNA-binding protein
LNAKLCRLYPAVFSWPPSVPLPVGIDKTIAELMQVDRVVVSQFLWFWTSRTSYLIRMAMGDNRRNLDGSICDQPDTPEGPRIEAIKALAKQYQRIGDFGKRRC